MPRRTSVIDDLPSICRELDGRHARKRIAILRRAAALTRVHVAPADLLRLHEAALFMAAFPVSMREKSLAERLLRVLSQAFARRATNGGDARDRRALANAGVAGSLVTLTPSLEMLNWIASRWPHDVQVQWRDDSPGEGFDDLAELLVPPCQRDGLFHPCFSMRAWVQAARGPTPEALWIGARCAKAFDEARLPSTMRDALFNRMSFTLRWRVPSDAASRTLCRFPPRKPFVLAASTPRPAPLDAVVAAPLPRARSLSRNQARRLIDTARAALAARGRETDPITYANSRDVRLLRLDRGVDVMLAGLTPQRRLPLEGFVGYLAARNQIPIAYGGGWMFLDQCTIGINLFDTFRGGESMHVFAQILRTYRQHFGMRVFGVDPFQFGQDNEEAIRSGAFWFYWRAGFRPVERDLLKLAEGEAQRIAADVSHRTSARVLRRLATGCMRRLFGDTPAQPFVDPCDVALALTAQRAKSRRQGDWLKTALELHDRDAHAERHFADLLAMIDDLPRRPRSDRFRLRQLIRAKFGPSEFTYLRLLRSHRRFRAALTHIAQQARLPNADRG